MTTKRPVPATVTREQQLEAALRECVAAISYLVSWCDGPMVAHEKAREQGRRVWSDAMAVLESN